MNSKIESLLDNFSFFEFKEVDGKMAYNFSSIEGYKLLKSISTEENELFKKFLDDLFSDVIIDLLLEAINKISEFFKTIKVKSKMKQYKLLYEELFYNEGDLDKMLNDLSKNFSFVDNEKVVKKVIHIDNLHIQIPKILLPWFYFVLTSTCSNPGKDLIQLQRKYLRLKSVRSCSNGISVFKQSQNQFVEFIEILKFIKTSDIMVNLSLNLHLFNKITNQYDLYCGMRYFENSDYMKLKKLYINNPSINIEGAIAPNEVEIKECLDSFRFAGRINAINVKTMVYNQQLYFGLLYSESYIEILNRIVLECKKSLRQHIVTMDIDKEEISVAPDVLKEDYAIYLALSGKETHSKIIKDLIDKKIDILNPTINDEIKQYLFEGYMTFYKIIYLNKKGE